jgi:hypothetical protein
MRQRGGHSVSRKSEGLQERNGADDRRIAEWSGVRFPFPAFARQVERPCGSSQR